MPTPGKQSLLRIHSPLSNLTSIGNWLHVLASTLIRIATFFVALLLASAGLLAEPLDQTDHPQIPRYPGSELVGFDSRYYDQAFIPSGQDRSSGQWVAGNFQWRAYRAPAGTSGDALFRHFDQVLGSAGFRVVHACVKARCGDSFILDMLQASIRHVSDMETWVNNSAYYMAVRLRREELDRWVSLLIYNTPDDDRPLIRLETVDVMPPRRPALLGGTVVGQETLPQGTITIAGSAATAEGIASIATLSGKVTRTTLLHEPDVSPYELLDSWLNASNREGFQRDFYCGGTFCGPDFIGRVRAINRQFPQAGTEVWKANSVYYFTALRSVGGNRTARAVLSYLQADGHAVSHLVEVASEARPQRSTQPPPSTGLPTLSLRDPADLSYTATMSKLGKVIVDEIRFTPDTAEITGADSHKAIAGIAAMLREKPSLSVYVDGHTNNLGSYEENKELSLQRARAVVDVLVSTYRLDPERLHARGFGKSKPYISNHTAQGRAKNRRIEFVYRSR